MTIAYIISIISVFFIALTDMKERIIPDLWLWPLLLSGLYMFGGDIDNVWAAIFGYGIGFVLMVALRKKEALGYGDVKLLGVAGLWLGVDGLSVAVVAACLMGIAWGLVKKERYVPFAPFLLAGTIGYYITKEILCLI